MAPPNHHSGARHAKGRTGFAVTAKVLLGVLLVALVLGVLHYTDFEWRDAPALLQRVNRPLALLLMATLPIVGFPISAVYLAAGAVFGPWIGGLVVTGATLVHVFATHVLARTVLRKRIETWRRKWSRRIPPVPPEQNVSLVAMIVIVPALPYLARNVLLALSATPLRNLLLVAVPLYVARSYVTIFIGDLGNDPSLSALLVLGGVFGAKLIISGLLFQHIRHRVRRPGKERRHRQGSHLEIVHRQSKI